MRKAIIIAVGIIIVFIGFKGYQAMTGSKNQPKPKTVDNVTIVFTEDVELRSVPVYIEASGVLEAVEKLELYSEVQGVMLPDGGRFKEGVTFNTGEVMVGIKANDVQAQLVALRSSYQKLLTSIMPDLKLDYSSEFPVWSAYLKQIDVNKSLPELPNVTSEQLKLFLTGRSVYSEYYNIKNAQINLSKFSIRAPYRGILTEANVDPGTVIRPGQKLGVFIRPNNYELKISVGADKVEKLKKGQKAQISLDKYFDKTWEGEISRVNRTVNTESQLSSVFIRTNSTDLKDGMFMHAKIQSSSEEQAMEVSRSMLFDEDKVFLVQDSLLVERTVKINHLTQNTAVISGLENGDKILSKIPPGAFSGMKVSIYQNTENK